MKTTFHIICNFQGFINIKRIFEESLKDIGYTQTENIDDAELIFAIQHFPSTTIKKTNRKYILIQTEQYKSKPDLVESFYKFNSDRIFGFDIDNKKEEYIVLGYHPSTEKSDIPVIYKYDVSILGSKTDRRDTWIQAVNNKPKYLELDYSLPGVLTKLKSSKISLNLHSYSEMNFTEWDRLTYLLSNKLFFITEKLYFPLKSKYVYFQTPNEYDILVDTYINSNEKIEISERLYEEYITNFDMRKILQQKGF